MSESPSPTVWPATRGQSMRLRTRPIPARRKDCAEVRQHDKLMRSGIMQPEETGEYSIWQVIKSLSLQRQRAKPEKGKVLEGAAAYRLRVTVETARRAKCRDWSRTSKKKISEITKSSPTLGWSRGLSSYEIKSLILISRCRLACNCLGNRKLPALCSLTARTRAQSEPSVAPICLVEQLNYGILAPAKIKVSWFNSNSLFFFQQWETNICLPFECK